MTGQLKDNILTKIAEENMTPMMRQYFEIKSAYRDAILFFRLGDFYEMFYEDAEIAARELSLTLTGRGKKETGNRMPMCGIPYHAADNYILRLINKGHKVAICEQVEDPALAKGLTKREVIKVITPGTLTEEKFLANAASNYLCAIIGSEKKEDIFGLAYADASTGEFKFTEIFGQTNLRHEIQRIEPAEIITDQDSLLNIFNLPSTKINTPGLTAALKAVEKQCHLAALTEFELQDFKLGALAAAAIINYLQQTQKSKLGQINSLSSYQTKHYMYIDTASRRNLELVQTIKNQERQGSLFWLLDKTKTAMGSRLLKNWINYPLLDKNKIEGRYQAIEELSREQIARSELQNQLQNIYDIERLIGRTANGNANARDLVALKDSLVILRKEILPIILNFQSGLINQLNSAQINEVLDTSIALVEKSIVDNPPLQLKDGDIIRSGYNTELDELRSLLLKSKTWVSEFEAKEKERTGIKSLKVGYTSVFGYYIEISNANKNLVPLDYQRKQTLTNAERYITPDLKEQETQILNASTKIEKLEYKIFSEIRDELGLQIGPIQNIAKLLAQLDVLTALAEVAVANNYIKPEIIHNLPDQIKIIGGRHPVVEMTMPRADFIPNDTCFDNENRFIMLFGPNMSGKSTFMRQTALLLLMAQIGSFVPADKMTFTLIDKLFTRVGAMDDLFAGMSTFMMEMTETANILKNASENSLIIMDEIGRGTSTYDGMAIAWAVAEYIYLKLKAKTLFATHYHELAELAENYPEIKNYNVAVEEKGSQITFLHKVIPGITQSSYGVHVASIAGLPSEVISRAQDILTSLKNTNLQITTKDEEQLKLI